MFQCVWSYGFKVGYTPDDVADLVVEAVSKAARWLYGQLIVVTLDIRTAFDAMKHNTLHFSNNKLRVPPVQKLPA